MMKKLEELIDELIALAKATRAHIEGANVQSAEPPKRTRKNKEPEAAVPTQKPPAEPAKTETSPIDAMLNSKPATEPYVKSNETPEQIFTALYDSVKVFLTSNEKGVAALKTWLSERKANKLQELTSVQQKELTLWCKSQIAQESV